MSALSTPAPLTPSPHPSLPGVLRLFERSVLLGLPSQSLPWAALVAAVQSSSAPLPLPTPTRLPFTPIRLLYSPLHYAAFYGKPSYARLFLARSHDPDARSATGATPLFVTASQGLGPRSRAVARLLVAAGADVNLRARGGVTPLMHAVRSGNADVVAVLLAGGAAWSGEDGEAGEGGGVLWEAVYRYDVGVARALAEGGVEVVGGDGNAAVREMAKERGPRAERAWEAALEAEGLR